MGLFISRDDGIKNGPYWYIVLFRRLRAVGKFGLGIHFLAVKATDFNLYTAELSLHSNKFPGQLASLHDLLSDADG